MQFWNELEGQVIDGVYPLRRLVRSEGRTAWFETETSDPRPVPATISLTEALTDADEVVARLEAAQRLNHPNLVSITKVGQVRVDNTLVVYALMEPIEQSLSDVLQSQALTADEGREVAEALVSGLTAIHQKGMSHGRVEAASVLATQETVKLRSDCLHLSAAGQGDEFVFHQRGCLQLSRELAAIGEQGLGQICLFNERDAEHVGQSEQDQAEREGRDHHPGREAAPGHGEPGPERQRGHAHAEIDQ